MRSRPLVLLAMVLVALPTFARIGTIDVTPAATLLFPHFEVDPNDPNGIDTILNIQNSSATAMLVNVTLWTDWGIPTDNFNIYLTGYDQESVDLFALFNQHAPLTASDGQDPTDTISPQGPLSQDINFASCSGLLMNLGHPVPPQLAAAHTGQAASDFFGAGNCGGRDYGDGIARGYVTVDTVNQCSVSDPSTPNYLGPANITTNQNTILGDYVILDRATGRAYVDTAAHIEASSTDPLVTTSGNATFYGRFIGNTAADNREPLPRNWAATYMSGRTTVDYYRDPGEPVSVVPCSSTPAQFPMNQDGVTAYNSTGTSIGVAAGNYFPYATGTSSVGGALPLAPKFGWFLLDLDTTAGARQSWITVRHRSEGLSATTPFGIAVPGIQIPPAP